MGEIDEDLWIKSLKSERVVVGLFGVFMGCIVNALVFHTLGRELSGVLFWGDQSGVGLSLLRMDIPRIPPAAAWSGAGGIVGRC